MVIDREGTIRFIYHDELRPFMTEHATIERASQVEPVGQQWFADMRLVKGPKLGPFDTHQAALDAEIAWLRANYL